MNKHLSVFDRSLYRKYRQKLKVDSEAFSRLACEVANRLVDRLKILKRDFKDCWQIGFDNGVLFKQIGDSSVSCLKEIKMFVVSDSICFCHDLYSKLSSSTISSLDLFRDNEEILQTVCCDEEILPIGANALDMIISPLGFQWVNDLKGVLLQCLYGLKPDGLMMAVVIGEDSLWELQSVFRQVEMKMFDGISNRFAPLISSKDAGSLLQSVGFSLPVVDRDRIILSYPNVATLLKDIKSSGNANILLDRQSPPLTRGFLKLAEDLYREQFSLENGEIQVTLDLIFMNGWNLSSKQQPIKSGSALLSSLAEVL